MRSKQDIKEEKRIITIWVISVIIALVFCACVDNELLYKLAIH